MGKLHTLRRAIEREPERWVSNWGYALGAARNKNGVWYPYYWGNRPYVAFVKHVLWEIRENQRLNAVQPKSGA